MNESAQAEDEGGTGLGPGVTIGLLAGAWLFLAHWRGRLPATS